MHIRMHMHMHMQMHMHMHMLHMHNSCACACCMCMCMCTCACACACAHVHVHVSYLVTGPGCRWHGLGAQPRSLHELLVACFCGSAEGDKKCKKNLRSLQSTIPAAVMRTYLLTPPPQGLIHDPVASVLCI
jgi:hypothetical protein